MTDAGLHKWSPEKIKTALDNEEIILLDVRTPQEYLFEHIEGALLFPMSGFKAGSLPKSSEKQIVLHCGSDARSGKIGELCLANGIEKLAHMEGGFGAWKKMELPYIGTDMATGAPKKIHSE